MATLRRKCEGCLNVFDVALDKDNFFRWKNNPNDPIRVLWTTDPFEEEIRGDSTKMWLCSRCCYEFGRDI